MATATKEKSSKKELIDIMINQTALPRKTIETVINAYESAVTQEIIRVGKVVHTGFATYEKKLTKERLGRNPSTGEQMHIAEKTRIRIKPGDTLVSIVREYS